MRTPRPRARARSLLLVSALAITAAACGGDDDEGEATAADTASQTTDQATADQTAATETTDETTDESAGQATGATETGTAGSEPTGDATSAPGPVELGPGVSDDEIRVGFYVFDAAGLTPEQQAQFPDQEAMAQLLTDEVNTAGGINGRTLVPVPVGFPIATREPAATLEQAGCTSLTQDDEVFSAMMIQNTTELTIDCLEAAGMVSLGWPVSGAASAETFEAYPHYVSVGALSTSRLAELVPLFQSAGLLPADAKLGIDTQETPRYQKPVDGAVVPALEAAGVEVVKTVYLPDPQSVPGQDAVIAAHNSAVLQLKDAGADHVWLIGGGLLPLNSMGNQAFHPQVLMTTAELPSTVSQPPPGFEGVSQDLLAGVGGFGYAPLYDVTGDDVELTPTGDACLERFMSAGIELNTLQSKKIAASMCDQFAVLVAGIEAAGDDLNADTFISGLESAGPIESANLLAPLEYGPGNRDGVNAVRQFGYVVDCSCFRYSGELLDIG